MSELRTAVSLVLDAARPQFEPVRAEFHATAVAAGIPLHVTLLFPFAPRDRLDDRHITAVEEFFALRAAFSLTLTGLAEFPGVVYAAPEPAGDLRSLMRALYERFPEYPPYCGEFPDPVPHATLAEIEHNASQEDVVLRIRARTDGLFPVTCAIEDVSLLEEHASERWRGRRRFRLAAP